jgi:prephenate dehydratase
MFYADLAVPREDVNCGRALVNLAEFARWVRTLGTYKTARDVSQPAEPGTAVSNGAGR